MRSKHLAAVASLLLVGTSVAATVAFAATSVDVGSDPGATGLNVPLNVGPGPGWESCMEWMAAGNRLRPFFHGFREINSTGPGQWAPSATERNLATELGAELLLVPLLTQPWDCSADSNCQDPMKGLRGDALLVVPKGWAPSDSPAGKRRTMHLHGGRFNIHSPFTFGYSVAAIETANRTGAPVLSIDYPLSPVGSMHDQLRAGLTGLRWLAAWDGSLAGVVCRPGMCAAAVELAADSPQGVAAAAPSFEELLEFETLPNIVLGGDSSGGLLALQMLAALTDPGWTGGANGSISIVAAAFTYAPLVEPAQHLSPTLVTSSFSQDESRGVVTGDPALYGVTLSQYWQGYAEVVRGALKGGGLSSITAEEALADFPLMNPLWASPEVLKQLPPLTIQVGGFDRYLAEAFEFAQRVAAAGARTVQLDVYDGMWNNFQMVHPGCGGGELEAAELCLSRTFAFVRAATGEPTAAGGGLGPESLGYPRVQFHGRWPSTEQRDAVKQSMYTW